MSAACAGSTRAALVAMLILLAAFVAFAAWTLRAVDTPPVPSSSRSAEVAAPAREVGLEPARAPEVRAAIEPTAQEIPAETLIRDPPAPRRRGRLPPKEGKFPPHVRTEAGVLEVQVMDGEHPLVGVPVAIHPTGVVSPPDRFEDVVDPGRKGITDGDGLVRFEALTPATYAIRAWAEPGVVVTGSRDVFDVPGSRFVLRVGHGIVHGRIFLAPGRPLAGARLRLLIAPRYGHPLDGRMVRSDEHGAFRFERVPAGFCLLIHEDSPANGMSARARFDLEPGEVLEVTLGRALEATPWTGTVRTTTGEVLAFPLRVEIDDARTGNEYALSSDAEGRFRCLLPPGDYVVGPDDVWIAEGRLHVHIGRESLERDLWLTSVVVRVVMPPGELADATQLVLQAADSIAHPTVLPRIDDRRPGTERWWWRVQPGRHRLIAIGAAEIRSAPPTGLEFDVAGQAGIVTIDIDLVRK